MEENNYNTIQYSTTISLPRIMYCQPPVKVKLSLRLTTVLSNKICLFFTKHETYVQGFPSKATLFQ
jgi:hypothetical protein